MIVETLTTMKEELLDDAANMEFKGGSRRAGWGAGATGASTFQLRMEEPPHLLYTVLSRGPP